MGGVAAGLEPPVVIHSPLHGRLGRQPEDAAVEQVQAVASGELERLLRDREDLELFSSPADVRFGAATLVQPDIFVVRQDRSKPSQEWTDLTVPVLAIEIISPGTAARDRGQKREIYQRAGVLSYWIVDVDARLVEQWSPADRRPEIIRESLEWRVDDESLGRIDLPRLFAKIVS